MKLWRERIVEHVRNELSVDVRALALMRMAFGVLVIVAPDVIPAFTVPGSGSMSPMDNMSP